MQEVESLITCYVYVEDVNNKMDTLGEIMKSEVNYKNRFSIKKVLGIFTQRWNQVDTMIDESNNLTTLESDHLVGSLMLHRERLRDLLGECDEKELSFNLQISKSDGTNSNTKRNHGQGKGQN